MDHLKKFIEERLFEHASSLKKIKHMDIENIEWVSISKLTGIPEDMSKVHSGKTVKIRPEGSIRFFEKTGNGSRAHTFNLMAIGLEFKFNSESESFEIIDIGSFVTNKS